MKKWLLVILVPFFLYSSKLIKIDLSKQKIYALENGKVVFSGNISSGKSTHKTPNGWFRIIEKDIDHVSNKYPEPDGGAKMPYMLRLTNTGIAIHQGYLPGYPASHGCIRVSKRTAKKLWYWSRIGTRVKIYGDASRYLAKKRIKVKKKKKRYVVKRSKKRYKTYKRSKKKYIRRYVKKRKINKTPRKSKRYYRRVASNSDYEIVEIYDVW
ncbi:MAG: L,D-transpeptidase family protein [Epsilonproteobacteria bacterium]|nr:L,D-transpeptidase family protein [Campylobacterota bacterium]